MLLTPYYEQDGITLYCGDCLEVMRQMPDGCVDAVITDPPYGIGIDVWDKQIDLKAFTGEVARLCTGLYSVFGMMPNIALWHSAAQAAGFHFMEHVIWVKRLVTPGVRLSRGHESIFIYAVGRKRGFYQTKGIYSDVKCPGILVDAVSIEALDRHIKSLWMKLEGRSDELTPKGKNQKIFNHLSHISDRSPKACNFTNVWSFFPPSCAEKDGKYLHPTEKPVEVMARLIEMLTPEGGIVLDPFLGSGTTALACKRLGRRFVGIELSAEYCQIAERRLAAEALQGSQLKLGEAIT